MVAVCCIHLPCEEVIHLLEEPSELTKLADKLFCRVANHYVRSKYIGFFED